MGRFAETGALKLALQHVLWIGGPPDVGKTSVARELAQKHSLQQYHLDGAEPAHFARATPERQPQMWAFKTMTMDQRWVLRPPAEMTKQVIASSVERVEMAVEDLLALPREPLILAEGPWFLPELIVPLLSSPRQAIWLEPTEDFKRASASRSDKPGSRHQTSDPERATRNWFKRDMLLADHIRKRAEEFGLTSLQVDGSLSIGEVAALVEKHFAPLLKSGASADG